MKTMKKSYLLRNLAPIFLVAAISILISCEKAPEQIQSKSFVDIYNSLPAEPTVKSPEITVVEVIPGNGPEYQTVYYKNEKMSDVYKGSVWVLTQSFAYTVEYINNLHFIYQKRMSGTDCFGPVPNSSYGDVRNLKGRIDLANNFVYFYAERWTESEIERAWQGLSFTGEVFYFRYSISSDKLVDESGKNIPLSKN